METRRKQKNKAAGTGPSIGRDSGREPGLRLVPRIIEVCDELNDPDADNIRGYVADLSQDISDNIELWYSYRRSPGVHFPWTDMRHHDAMSREEAARFFGLPVGVFVAPKGYERLAFQFPSRDGELFLMNWKPTKTGED